ncbi:MAG: ATP-binding protein [Myxococcota bacterium]
MEITSTKKLGYNSGLKILVHGPPGSGKTRLCSTTGDLEHTLIVSAEGGLLSVKEYDIDVVEVATIHDVYEVYTFLQRDEHAYTWVCLDSISEIAEVVLQGEKLRNRDARRAYAEMADTVFDLLRGFRNLPLHVVMTAKQGREEIDGRTLHAPMLPGRQLTQNIAYLFDEVFALRVETNSEHEVIRVLQTGKNRQFEAKDRSGLLQMFERADLDYVSRKIRGEDPDAEDADDEGAVIQRGTRGEKRIASSVSGGERVSASSDAPRRTSSSTADELRRVHLRRQLFLLLKSANLSNNQIVNFIRARCETEQGSQSIDDVPVDVLEMWARELEEAPNTPEQGRRVSPRQALVREVLRVFTKKSSSAA